MYTKLLRKIIRNGTWLWLLVLVGCEKYLSPKPDKALVVPKNLDDLQAILDNANVMNLYANAGIGEASSDNYYLTENDYNALFQESSKSIYHWGSEIVYADYPNAWSDIYSVVGEANTVLSHLTDIVRNNTNNAQWDAIKGEALFFRAYAFSVTAFNWAVSYDSTTASTELGIPLRLTDDFNEKSTRATLKATYEQIITDLNDALRLLPVQKLNDLRPSQSAAYGLLSRVYLSMGRYQEAALYADSCLTLAGRLIDYNDLDSTTTGDPFSQFNEETIFYESGSNGLLPYYAKIDTFLYRSYAENDLRKNLFFQKNADGTYSFKGNYTGNGYLCYFGIATDEIYLNKAECLARYGKVQQALDVLNELLRHRYRKGSFQPLSAASIEEAMQLILEERRKELVMRDLRWMDLKRLNKEKRHQVTLYRIIDETRYELPPNDPRYALPLPDYVIKLTGMKQNPR